MEQNAQLLQQEMQWLAEIITTRLALFLGDECAYKEITEIEPPGLDQQPTQGTYADYIIKNDLNLAERIILALSLAPHIEPEVLDKLYLKNATYDKVFTQFGGWYDKGYTGFIPTIETAFFLLSHGHLTARFQLQQLFDGEHLFIKTGVLNPEAIHQHTPLWSRVLKMSQEYVDIFTRGYARKPDFSTDFPAKRVTTQLDWDEIVLNPYTKRHILELKDWLDYSPILLNGWGLGRKINKGYKCLFYGPPGTGKSLTACVLGKSVGREVYRIDLSLVVSKYIGETEKNLAKVFDQAQHKDWILFFDEADALFGKRTETKTSNDRHANQEVAYLLQRLEDFPGLAILATNLKDHIDEAFSRRFQAMIHFPMPNAKERLQLWETGFSDQTPLAQDIDLKKVAEEHILSGGTIINVVRYCSIKAAKRQDHTIQRADIAEGIKKELHKEGIAIL